MVFIILVGLGALFLDQLTKLLTVGFFMNPDVMLFNGLLDVEGESIVLIPKTLSFTYVLNEGAAFGILENQRIFFLVTTLLVVGGGFILLFRYEKKHILLKISSGLILGGALGNFVDRVIIGVVRDFIDLTLVDSVIGYSFPVFNVADIFVVVGVILLAVYILFIHDKIYPPQKDKK